MSVEVSLDSQRGQLEHGAELDAGLGARAALAQQGTSGKEVLPRMEGAP